MAQNRKVEMDSHSWEQLRDTLRDALTTRMCVSAWLGYGNALFIGFGDSVIPARDEQGHRNRPLYEITTEGADWNIGKTTCEDEDDDVQQAVAALIGLRVLTWQLDDSARLTIQFVGNINLQIIPDDEILSDMDQWWVRTPADQCIGIGTARSVISGGYHEDPEQWTGRPHRVDR